MQNFDEMDFDQIAEAQGWNADTLVGLLREYISNQHADDALDEFARQKAAEENDNPKLGDDGDGIKRCPECWTALTAGDRTLGICGECKAALPDEPWKGRA